MSTTTTVLGLASGALTFSAGAAQATTPDGPWWWVGLIAAATGLGVFVKWLVTWAVTHYGNVMARQDAMHAENMKAAIAREERLHKRCDDQSVFSQTQTVVLQKIADRMDAHATALANLPDQVAGKIGCRKPPMA